MPGFAQDVIDVRRRSCIILPVINEISLTVRKGQKVKFEVTDDQIEIIKLVQDKLSKSYEPDLLSLSLKLAGVIKALDAQVLTVEDSHAAIMAAIRQKKP